MVLKEEVTSSWNGAGKKHVFWANVIYNVLIKKQTKKHQITLNKRSINVKNVRS